MSRRLATAALAIAALALNAPAALADAPTYECRLRWVRQGGVTGDSFGGVLAGVIVHPGPVSLRCRVTVNGVTQGQAAASGDGVAVPAAEVSFTADDYAVVRVCADYTSTDGSGTTCITIGMTQNLPHVDYPPGLMALIWRVVDPPICEVLKLLAPGTPPVFVNSQGDVYVDGEPLWDCPPYDIDWG